MLLKLNYKIMYVIVKKKISEIMFENDKMHITV